MSFNYNLPHGPQRHLKHTEALSAPAKREREQNWR